MTFIWHTGLQDQIYHHYEKKYQFTDVGNFNDVVDFEELI